MSADRSDGGSKQDDRFQMPAISGEEALRRHREAIGAEEAVNSLSELSPFKRLLVLLTGALGLAFMVLLAFFLLTL